MQKQPLKQQIKTILKRININQSILLLRQKSAKNTVNILKEKLYKKMNKKWIKTTQIAGNKNKHFVQFLADRT